MLVQGKQGGRHGCWRRRAGEGAVQPWEGKESCSLLQPWEAGLPALACVQEEEEQGRRVWNLRQGERGWKNLGAMYRERRQRKEEDSVGEKEAVGGGWKNDRGGSGKCPSEHPYI